MPAEVSENEVQAPRHAIGRRALLGLAILTITTGGAATLLYGSMEPGATFPVDPDAAQRRAILSAITSWHRVADPSLLSDRRHERTELLVIDAAAVEGVKRSTVQKIVEPLQVGDDGTRRPVMAAMHLERAADSDMLATFQVRLDAVQQGGFDGVFVDCAALFSGDRRPSLDAVAVALAGLVTRVRQLDPTFLVVLANARELAADPRVDRLIDGVARDNLLFGLDGAGVANSRTDVVSGLSDLTPVRKSGRAVFVTEHLGADAAEQRAGARLSLAALGFLVRFATSEALR